MACLRRSSTGSESGAASPRCLPDPTRGRPCAPSQGIPRFACAPRSPGQDSQLVGGSQATCGPIGQFVSVLVEPLLVQIVDLLLFVLGVERSSCGQEAA